MATILGIDAAWTAKEPTGVAMISSTLKGWRSIATAPSYDAFMGLANSQPINWSSKFYGHTPKILELLKVAEKLSGQKVSIVAVDMPLSHGIITKRRIADKKTSKEFGGRWCSTHSPTKKRPGRIGATIHGDLKSSGYNLKVESLYNDSSLSLIEVYPHTALLSLLKRDRRVPYKVSKSLKYWPGSTVSERKIKILQELLLIYKALTSVFGDIGFSLPETIEEISSLAYLKRYEDALDALVCAWMGIQYFEGNAVPLGDHTAAIWSPRDVVKIF